MASISNVASTETELSSHWTRALSGARAFREEAQTGDLSFTIVCVNMVAIAIFAGKLALYGGSLMGTGGLATAAVVLPSIALFGPTDYLDYLPHPLRMGFGFVLASLTTTIEKNGGWVGKFAHWGHFDDQRLGRGLVSFFKEHKIGTAIDCGCGDGFYVKGLRNAGINEVYGCDYHSDTEKLGEGFFRIDLARPNALSNVSEKAKQYADRKFPCVISLEVAEHIPHVIKDEKTGETIQSEKNFLDNITSLVEKDGWLILSWARKGQGGIGHDNEQNAPYVLETMKKRGWVCQKTETEELRKQSGPKAKWFRNTIFVFKRASDK